MVLTLKNITKSYQNASSSNERRVLNAINLSVLKGDSISIVGPSGSGKSTLLNIMGTLDNPSSGSVLFKGNTIESLSANNLAEIRNRHFGFVFQQHHLLPQLSLLENVMIPLLAEKNNTKKESAMRRAKELLDLVGLADKTRQLPGQLSVGECQRTAVIRALINEPELLLADEPTGSLDEEAAENLVELLVKINATQNIALVMVTHATQLADKMNKSYKLTGGNLSEIKS